MPTKPGIYLRGGEKASFDEPGKEIGERELVFATDTREIGTKDGWFSPIDKKAVAFFKYKDDFNLNSNNLENAITGYNTGGYCLGNQFDEASGILTISKAGVYKFDITLSLDGVGSDDTFFFIYSSINC